MKTRKTKKQIASSGDVLSYHLNPKMSILKSNEKQKILDQFGLSEDMLPKIQIDDPVAVALGAKTRDLIKILRNDGTGDYAAYRIVVDA